MTSMRTALVAAALSVGLTTGASAATEWILATGLPDSNFFSKNYMQFIQEVEKESGGELKIKYAGNNSLVKRDAIRRAIQTAQIQMGEVDFVNLGNENPVFLLDSLPGLVLTYDDAWALMEAQKPYAEKLFAERGLRIIGYAPWPGQGFFSKAPIAKLDDAKGIKLRIYSETTKKMGEILGFRPTILPAAEIPQAFASGLIEAMFTSPATGVISQAWDNTKYLLFVGGFHSKQSLAVNDAAFKSLSPKLQKVLLDAGERATKRGWKLSEEDNVEALKALEKNGMKVSYAFPELKAKMEKEIGPAIIGDWKKSAPPDAAQVLDAYLKKVKR